MLARSLGRRRIFVRSRRWCRDARKSRGLAVGHGLLAAIRGCKVGKHRGRHVARGSLLSVVKSGSDAHHRERAVGVGQQTRLYLGQELHWGEANGRRDFLTVKTGLFGYSRRNGSHGGRLHVRDRPMTKSAQVAVARQGQGPAFRSSRTAGTLVPSGLTVIVAPSKPSDGARRRSRA